jgi:mono/diheme cytochrome c family protein/predicted  nucleic acid-binding Zn-ribbon protein
MAEEKEAGEKKPGAKLDPIVDHSTATGFLVSSLILFLTVGWSIADEVWIRRPYKARQGEFRDLATKKVENDLKVSRADLEQQKGSDDFKVANKKLEDAQAAALAQAGEVKSLNDELRKLTGDLNDTRGEFQQARGEYQPLVYELDQANHEGHKAEAEELKKKIAEREPKIKEIFDRMNALSTRRQDVQGRLQAMKEPVEAAAKELAAKVPAQQKINDAGAKQEGVRGMSVDIVQIYNPALKVVDRCQSCHIATDKPGYAAEDWDTAKGTLSDAQIAFAKKVFATHPSFKSTDPAKWDALEAHPLQKFGCTTCHFGNGPAVNGADFAHELEDHGGAIAWDQPRDPEFELTPMLGVHSSKFGNMMEASCAKCHLNEVELRGAPQLSLGRQLVEDVGCWGCHKIQGFEVKETELASLKDKLETDLKPERERLGEVVTKLKAGGDEASDEKKKLAAVNHDIQIAERRVRELDLEVKFIGPDLNRKGAGGLRSKINPQWLPRWIYDPQHFRPGTWMPNPLLDKDQAVEAAAYIWQQADGAPEAAAMPAPSPEMVAEGERLVETKGCLACHTLESKGAAEEIPEGMRGAAPSVFRIYDVVGFWQDPAKIAAKERASLLKKGTAFAPALDRVGEKIRTDWIAKWVKDPKAVQPHTRMPNLRLNDDEAAKVAAYLSTLKKDAPGGEEYKDFDVAKLEDKALAKKGFEHVRRYGCFNCHAIDLKDVDTGKPIANPGKIGAELSSHGSKPLAQFDFGFLEHKIPAYRPVWLQTKILEPRVWDDGKYKGDPTDRLRMPRFGLTVEEAQAITTVLAGLTDAKVPGDYVYAPDERAAALIEGERLVKKFNCRSCHIIDGKGQYAHDELIASIAKALKKSPDDCEIYLPPTLNGEGHRAQPDWLFRFLKNPGVANPFAAPGEPALRPWHVLKMPTFDMSDAEATALVRFFGALEKEEFPYLPRETAPDDAVVARGRQLFKENQCFSCHQIGEYRPSGKKPIEMGPNFALAHDRLREDWIWRFVPDPQSFIPGTNMPAPAPFGSKPYALQPKEKKEDIRALAAYIRALAAPEFREKDGWTAGLR